MFKHILIAIDVSKAVTTGLELAKALGAKLTFVVVTEPRTHFVPVAIPPVLTEDDEALKRAAEAVLVNARAHAAVDGTNVPSQRRTNQSTIRYLSAMHPGSQAE